MNMNHDESMSLDIRTVVGGLIDVNTYVIGIRDGDACIVIDPGAEAQRVAQAVSGRQVEAVLLTHGHFDHIGGLRAIAEYTGAPCYVPKDDITLMQDPNLALSFDYPLPPLGEHLCYEYGTPLCIAGCSVTPMHCPGHTPGTTSFLLTDYDEKGTPYRIAIHGGLGFAQLRDEYFTDAPSAVAARNRYRKTQTTLLTQPVDIPLSFHPYNVHMLERLENSDWRALIQPEMWKQMLSERLVQLSTLEQTSMFTNPGKDVAI